MPMSSRSLFSRSIILSLCGLLLPALCAGATSASKPASKPKLPPAPAGVIIKQDVAYLLPDRKEKLDLYLPAERSEQVRSPAVLIIHGGGWGGGDKAASREFNIGTTLAKAGYVCASVNYRLEAPHRWPNNLLDCKNAVRFLRKNAEKYQIDPKHVGVIGGSAGGHLALMVAYTTNVPDLEPASPYPGVSDHVSAVVNLYGITNLLTRKETDSEGNPVSVMTRPSSLMDQTMDKDMAGWRLASPVFHVSAKSPPTLILHGTLDTTVDRDQATELAAKLKEQGVEHRLMLIEGTGHTFDLQTWRRKPLPQDLRPVVVGFFDRHLKKAIPHPN